MDGEAKSLIKVCILATTCLCYCYYIASKIPKGVLRLLSLLPVFYLFIILPLEFTSIHLCGLTTFFLTWLATFKLLLFSFDQGPLSPHPQKVIHFISLACLPIKIKQNDLVSARDCLLNENKYNTKFLQKPCSNSQPSINLSVNLIPKLVLLSIKVFILVNIIHSYNYKPLMHPHVVLILYCLHLYLELEIVLAISSTPARVLLGFELEPQFNEPYLATSLQDFWGHRWNLMVTNILRPTVYYPIRKFSKRLIGPTWASLPAVISTFVISGLTHEIIYFYLTRVNPTWEVTWFFILHGACVAIEVTIKKVVKDRWRLHPIISGQLTIIFVAVTGIWLFFPQIIRNGVDEKVIRENSICIDFVKHKFRTFSFFST